MLTEKEVLHIAKLAKIKLTPVDIERYQQSLSQLMAEIETVSQIEIEGDIMISPSNNQNRWFEKGSNEQLNEDLLKNAPNTEGSFIEVERALNE